MTQPTGEIASEERTVRCACGNRIHLLFHLACSECENRGRLAQPGSTEEASDGR